MLKHNFTKHKLEITNTIALPVRALFNILVFLVFFFTASYKYALKSDYLIKNMSQIVINGSSFDKCRRRFFYFCFSFLLQESSHKLLDGIERNGKAIANTPNSHAYSSPFSLPFSSFCYYFGWTR